MVQRGKIVLGIVAIACVLLIAYNQKGEVSKYRNLQYDVQELQFNDDIYIPVQKRVNFSNRPIKEVINIQRESIKNELFDYVFPPGMSLKDFTMETGGQPLRSVIITTWRSGSTFLGDILDSVPGNYYHYEPLLNFGIKQVRKGPLAKVAIKNLKSLLNCDYSDLGDYLEYGMSHVNLFTHNHRLWEQCERYPNYCWNSTFLNKFCKLFPFQSMKTVRLRLKLAEELLEDRTLNVKVVLLVRDPRGILQSRKHRVWCPGEPDCNQPDILCSDMVSDYYAAARLQELYPRRFRAIRFEDLSQNHEKHIRDLFKFFGLYFHTDVELFLESHTKINLGGVSSTFRDTKSAPFHWRTELNYTEVEDIQENCKEAMKLWGYVNAQDEDDLHAFHPVTKYTIKKDTQ